MRFWGNNLAKRAVTTLMAKLALDRLPTLITPPDDEYTLLFTARFKRFHHLPIRAFRLTRDADQLGAKGLVPFGRYLFSVKRDDTKYTFIARHVVSWGRRSYWLAPSRLESTHKDTFGQDVPLSGLRMVCRFPAPPAGRHWDSACFAPERKHAVTRLTTSGIEIAIEDVATTDVILPGDRFSGAQLDIFGAQSVWTGQADLCITEFTMSERSRTLSANELRVRRAKVLLTFDDQNKNARQQLDELMQTIDRARTGAPASEPAAPNLAS